MKILTNEEVEEASVARAVEYAELLGAYCVQFKDDVPLPLEQQIEHLEDLSCQWWPHAAGSIRLRKKDRVPLLTAAVARGVLRGTGNA